jgi:hypothetical protein
MIPDEEKEDRFQRWSKFILAKIGYAEMKVLRYLWDLYDELIDQIKELKKKPPHNNNN